MTDPLRVLFIGGAGRSGSTLLERLLATAPGVVAAGELVHLWDRGVGDDQLCGCGESFHACPTWTRVGQLAFGGWDTPAATAAAQFRRRVDRQRNLPGLILPGLTTTRWRRALRAHLDAMTRLYRAIAIVGGGHTVIDSSKHGSTAHVLRHLSGPEVRLVQMVRHPGGVAHSWTRSVTRPEITDAVVGMPTYTPARSSLDWLLRNIEVTSAGALGDGVETLRYEDLVADPQRALALLADRVHLPDPPAVTGRHVVLGVDHTVAGNPLRFRTGPLDVRNDDTWEATLAERDRRIVRVLTAPLSAVHGYRWEEHR